MIALEFCDVLAERRLGDVQLLGGVVVVKLAGQCDELVVILDMNSGAPSFPVCVFVDYNAKELQVLLSTSLRSAALIQFENYPCEPGISRSGGINLTNAPP